MTSGTSTVESLLNDFKRKLGLSGASSSGKPFPGSEGAIDPAPFVPLYAKGEKIYRLADWTYSGDGRADSKGPVSGRVRGSTAGMMEDDDWTLSLADSSAGKQPSTASASIRRGGRGGARGVLPPRSMASSSTGSGTRGTGSAGQKGFHANSGKKLGWGQKPFDRQRTREPSVKIDPSWSLLEEIEFSRISRLQFDPDGPELIKSVGSLPFYNKSFDRLTTKSAKLVNIEDVHLPGSLRIKDDRVMMQLAQEYSELQTRVVLMTDSVAALLMAAPRTVQSWDLEATRLFDRVMALDQRTEGSTFALDQVHINETAYDSPSDEREVFNSAYNLAQEATRVNSLVPNIICASDDRKSYSSTDSTASNAYFYYKWPMGEELVLIIRSQLYGLNRVASNEQSIFIASLLEYDFSRNGAVDWRSKLDNQRGAVLANEIKNNNATIARWVFQAYMAQADTIKLAYVSRISSKDRIHHELLGLHDLEPYELAVQMNLDMSNGFGILKTFSELLLNSESSALTLLRDPSKPVIRLYSSN